MKDAPSNPSVPTLESSIEHLDNYVRGALNIQEFWKPFPAALEAYADYPADPYDRLPYYWRRVAGSIGNIIRLGYDEDEDFSNHMKRWLDALRMDKAQWDAIVARKGSPLIDNVEDWDK